MTFTWNRLFLILAFVLFLLAALAGGGIISISGSNAWEWLMAGGAASTILSMLV